MLQDTEIAMLNDLYRNNNFGIPNISEYTDEVIDTYVKAFYEKRLKRTTFADVAIPQNTKIWHQTQANMFGNSKPDSKPK
jgi:hypothetical protein